MSDDLCDILEIVDGDFDAIEKKLANGGGQDPVVFGQALGLILKHMRVMVRRKTVTEHDCRERREQCGHKTGAGLLPETVAKMVSQTPPWAGLLLYVIGKNKGWW